MQPQRSNSSNADPCGSKLHKQYIKDRDRTQQLGRVLSLSFSCILLKQFACQGIIITLPCLVTLLSVNALSASTNGILLQTISSTWSLPEFKRFTARPIV